MVNVSLGILFIPTFPRTVKSFCAVILLLNEDNDPFTSNKLLNPIPNILYASKFNSTPTIEPANSLNIL